MNTLNAIGCGRVGKTLARLGTEHRVFRVGCVLNRSLESGQRAVDFVGGGRAVDDYPSLEPAELVMISASDEAIEPCCRRLVEADSLGRGAIVFHCSGSLPSSILEPAKAQGALIASVHPVKSFADPGRAVDTFEGTFCAIEGDAAACDVLRDALARCGAVPFSVDPRQKTVYHAGTVFVCNYLVALLEVGLQCFDRAGIPRATAMEIIGPIVEGTAKNFFELGPVRSLTGPIARGEASVVERQREALGACDERAERLYQLLGQVAAELSAAQGNADEGALEAIRELLK